MSEWYLCMSSIAEAHCPACIHFELERHCFGTVFAESIPEIKADRAFKAWRLPGQPGLSAWWFFFSFSVEEQFNFSHFECYNVLPFLIFTAVDVHASWSSGCLGLNCFCLVVLTFAGELSGCRCVVLGSEGWGGCFELFFLVCVEHEFFFVCVERGGDLWILLTMEEESSDGTASRSCEP